MAKIGGEGSSVDSNFADAYARISGTGASAQDQINRIQSSVDNKLVTSQQEGQQYDNRRELTGVDKTLADVSAWSDDVATGAGNAIFGEASGFELTEDPLKFLGRTLADIPGGIVTMPTRTAGRVGAAFTGTDYTYYDPETATVPDDEYGELNALGRIGNIGAAVTEVFMGGKGLGATGRAGQAAVRGAAGAGAGKIAGTGVAKGAAKGAGAGFSGQKGIASVSSKGGIRGAYEDFAGKNFATRALHTGLEEGAQEIVEESFEWLARNDDDVARGSLSDEQWQELGQSIAAGGVGGFLGGGVVGTIGGAAKQYSNSRASKAAETATASDNNSQDNPSGGRVPSAYNQVPGIVTAAIKESDRPDASHTGQSGTVYADNRYGVNSFGMGENTLAAIYMTEEGQNVIDQAVGRENVEWVQSAILDPSSYVSQRTGQQGRDAARADLTTLFNSLENDALLFKYPATGKQMLMSLTGIEPGTGIWTNGDVASIFNGDFDTDKLGVELSGEATTDGIDTTKIRPSQLLASAAVSGQSLLDSQYTTFSPLAKGDRTVIRELLSSAGIEASTITEFLENYSKEGNDAKVEAVTRLLSFEGKDLPNRIIDALWNILRKSSRTLDAGTAEAKVEQANTVIAQQMEKAVGQPLDFEGSVNADATSVTAQVQIGRIDPTKEGPALRSISERIWESRRTQDNFGPDEITETAQSALAQLCNDELAIVRTGQTPLNLLIELYHTVLADRVRTRMAGKPFASKAEFEEVFNGIANELRPDFEASQYYKVFRNSQLYQGFTGFSEDVRELGGGIIEFQRTFGAAYFTDFFNAPESYNDMKVSQVFDQISESRNGYTDAFILYGEEQSDFNRAAANAHSRASQRIGEKLQENVNALFEGDAKLEVNNGIVADTSMASLIARYSSMLAMLRSSISTLNLSTIQELRNFSEQAYQALIGTDPERFTGLILSLKVMAETMPLQAAMTRYNETKNSYDFKRMRWEAQQLADGNSPVYRLLAAQVYDSTFGEDVQSGVFDTLISLYYEDAPSLNVLQEYLGAHYDMGDYGTTLGSLAADILNTSDDVTMLAQTRYDFNIASRYARQASKSSEAYAKRNFDHAVAVASKLGYNTRQTVAVIKRLSEMPTAIDEDIMSEQLREGSFISNAKKEKANDDPYAVLLDEGLLEVQLDGRTNADAEMFDIAGNAATAESFFASKKQLHDLIFGEPDTQVTLKTNYGKRRMTFTKVEFFEQLTGMPWDETGDHAAQIMNLLQMRPKIAEQLGTSRLTVSITGNTAISKQSDLSDSIIRDNLRTPERERERLGIETIKSLMAPDMRTREIVLAMMSEMHGQESLPYADAARFNDLFKRAWNQLARLVYHDIATLDGVTPENASMVSRHKQSAQFMAILRDILTERTWSKTIGTMNLFGDEMKRSIKAQGVLNQAIENFGEAEFTLQLPTEASTMFGEDARLNAEQLTFITNLNAAIDIYEQASSLDAPPPSREQVITDFNRSLPTKASAPEEFEMMKQQARDEAFPGDMRAYKKALTQRFADQYTEEVHQENIRATDMAYEQSAEVLRLPQDFESTIDNALEESIRDSDVTVRVDGINNVSAYKLVQKLKGKRQRIITAREEAVRSLEVARDMEVAQIERADLGPAERAESLEIAERNYDRSVQAKQAIYDAQIREEVQAPWQDLRIAIANAEISDSLRRLNIQGDPLNTEALSDLERLQAQYIEMIDDYSQNKPDGVTFSPLLEESLETADKFIMPKFSTLDPALREVASNARMSMRGGTTPGGVGDGAQGTGWQSTFGLVGEYAKCVDQGAETTLQEALQHNDVTLIQLLDGDNTVEYRFSDSSAMAKVNAILETDPETPVRAFYKSQCKCPGVCMNHTTKPKNNWSTSDNRMSTFYNRLSYFMQELAQMKQKKNLKPSDIKRLFADAPSSNPELAPRYMQYAPESFNQIQEVMQDFKNSWTQHIQVFIDENLNGGVNAEMVQTQDMLLDLDFAIDIADFVTRYASIRVVSQDGTVSEEYNFVGDIQRRAEELSEALTNSGIQAEIQISPVMVSPEDSSYAAIRYANARQDSDMSRERLLMLGLQDPGARIVISEEGISTTTADTFMPGDVNLSEEYGQMAPQTYDATVLPPSVDQDSPYMNYIKRLFGEADTKRQGKKRNAEPKPTIQLSNDSYQRLNTIPAEVLGGTIRNNLFLVNKTDSQRITSGWKLKRLSSPVAADTTRYDFNLDMPRFEVGAENTPVVIMDETNGGSDFESYRNWVLETYDQTVIIFVANGQKVPSKYTPDPDYTQATDGYDAYMVYPTVNKDIDTNGYRLAPRGVQSHWIPVVGGDQANASVVFPNDLEGMPFTFNPVAFLDVRPMLKGREGTVTWVNGSEQELVLQAWNNPEEQNATFDLSEHDNRSEAALSQAFTSYAGAELTRQGMRNDANFGDIIGVLKLPGDPVEYKPIFLEDLPALGSQIDTFTVSEDSSGAGFLVHGSYSSTFTPGTYKKLLGVWSSYKSTGTIATELGETLVMQNGQGAIEMNAEDLFKKTEQTRLVDDMKMWVAYQMTTVQGHYRNLFGEVGPEGTYVPKTTLNPELSSDPRVIDALSNQDNIAAYRILLQKNLKAPEFHNEEGQRLVTKFIQNVLTTPAVSPGKYLSPGFNENGKGVGQQYTDDAISLIFHDFTYSEKLKFWNYVTDGELCPDGVNGEVNPNMVLDAELNMADINGERVYWGFQDGLFNYEDSSDVDLPSSAGIIIGTQQSAMSSMYSRPATLDFEGIVSKQNLDAGDLGPVASTSIDELLLQSDQAMNRRYSQKTQGELVFDQIADQKAAGLATGTGFWAGWSERIAEVRRAFYNPVDIHFVEDEKTTSLTQTQKDLLLSYVWKITGQDEYANPSQKMSWFNLRQLLSSLITYSDIPGSNLNSITIDVAQEVFENYAKTLDASKRQGQYPRMEYMWKGEDATQWRYGMISNRAMLDVEWSFPAVRRLFDNDKKSFLNAAAEFQKKQNNNIVNVEGSAQKRSALQAYQLFLQEEYNGIIDVGRFDPIDFDGKMAANERAVYEALGVDSGDAAINAIMGELNYDYIERIKQINIHDSMGRKARKQEVLRDDAGNPKAPRQVKQVGRGSISGILDKLLGLRIGNSLVGSVPIAASAITRTVGGGFIMRQAGRLRHELGERNITNQGIQPSDYSLITDRAADGLLKRYSRDWQMVSAWGEPQSTLEGYFTNPDVVQGRLEELKKRGGIAKAWQRFGGKWASGFGVGQRFIVSDWILRMGQLMGDTEWLSNHYGREITAPLMTQAEWEQTLSSNDALHNWLSEASQSDSQFNLVMRAAMQDSQRATLSRQNGVYQLFRSVMRSMPGGTNTEKAFSTFVYPYMNYATNVTAWAANAIYAIPSETLLYALHHNGNKLQQYLHANNIENKFIDRIDWQLLDSSRGIKEALLRDAVRFGGFQLLATFAAGLLPIGDPEDDDLKDEWTEYTICGQRINLMWPLSDVIGPIGPLIVYWHTVQNGDPRPNLLWNGFYDTARNGAVTKAESFVTALNDPLAWLDDISDADMAYLNGENPEEYDPEQAALNGFFLQGVGTLYSIATPGFIDDVIKIFQHDTTAPSSNYIYEVDDSGKPTGRINEDTGQAYLQRADYDDIQWRRLTRNKPLLGLVTDIFTGSGFAGDGTGYMGSEMPDIVRYEPYQVESAKLYSLNGDEEHDSQVAADVIFMLGSYDDMDELISTGFYINAETRYYVGQKIWDVYWSYEEQINEAKALGLNDYYALGDGDYLTGQKVWQTWLNNINTQKQFYYDLYQKKLNSPQLRTRMLTANMMVQQYGTDATGETYGTGYPNNNPWALVSIGSQNNAGLEGGFSSISPLTGLPVGERGWRWNTANTYYDSIDFEAYAESGEGDGYSSVFSGSVVLDELANLADAYNPDYAGSSSSGGYRYSSGGGGGRSGGGGGGGSSFPKLYSNPQDISGKSAALNRTSRLSSASPDFLRPAWQTKGSREATRRNG